MSEQRRKRRKRSRIIWIVIVAVLIMGGGLTYYLLTRDSTEQASSTEPAMQTATVRQGDLTLLATGAGTLVAGDEMTFGFETEGTLAEVLVVKGDTVEEGDLIARLDDTEAQQALEDSQFTLSELTSTLSIAEVKVNIAALEEEESVARNELAYLISPEVLYYEERLTAAQEDLAAATAANDEDAIAEAEKAVSRAEANITYFQKVYREEYVPDTFTVEEQDPDNPRQKIEVIYAPSTFDINNAWNEYLYIVEEIKAANDYLTALQTGEIPEGATSSDIATLRSAIQAVETAQEDLVNLELYTPIPGVVTELNAKVGEQPDSSFITILDLYHPYLEIYLDASDWAMIGTDYDVEVEFDSCPGLVLTGKVSYIDPYITSTGGASLIYGQVTLDDDSLAQIADLPMGSEATVNVIEGSAPNAILVPIEALHQAGDQYSVFVVENGETTVRFVEVGLMDTYYAQVLSGLEVGEVVTTGIVETN